MDDVSGRRWAAPRPPSTTLLGYVCFFNISTGSFVCVLLPCFENHSVLDRPDGLLLLQHKTSSVIRLLHPFTGDVVLFPSLSSIFPQLSKVGCYVSGFDRLRIVFAAVSVSQRAWHCHRHARAQQPQPCGLRIHR
ncbi:hypothetical protein ACQ4PT_022833 [Festuca glaucescens]